MTNVSVPICKLHFPAAWPQDVLVRKASRDVQVATFLVSLHLRPVLGDLSVTKVHRMSARKGLLIIAHLLYSVVQEGTADKTLLCPLFMQKLASFISGMPVFIQGSERDGGLLKVAQSPWIF